MLMMLDFTKKTLFCLAHFMEKCKGMAILNLTYWDQNLGKFFSSNSFSMKKSTYARA
jgi:hypothetical protein